MGCDPKMKDSPPFRASAIAIVSLLTLCMIADTKGILRLMRDSSFAGLYLASGVRREILSTVHSGVVSPGMSRYSPKVCDVSGKMIAIGK